ncbi:uncharacterized protein LOC120010920 [Tripterygium wilfordii]|uniref:uncharacterized protein LOC120010920 n=1 Tax=Tripterygium wilfordii TaxID=458696 RepID=UPI0018F8462B|nr:uncharacterized protein LOC120010920 [Tripterygium wilfordii]
MGGGDDPFGIFSSFFGGSSFGDGSRGQRQRQRQTRGEDVVHPLKDHILEMVYPTYVKHVAQVGWDGPSGNAPSWVCCSKHECDMNIIAVCKKIILQLHRLQSTLGMASNS